jgi:hypothetical protein
VSPDESDLLTDTLWGIILRGVQAAEKKSPQGPLRRAGFFISGAENSPYSINSAFHYFNDVKATFDHLFAIRQ